MEKGESSEYGEASSEYTIERREKGVDTGEWRAESGEL